MKKTGILNPSLISAIASLGHTDRLMIADAGMPIHGDVTVIDLSLRSGIPSFRDTLEAIMGEMVVEGYIIASETNQMNKTTTDAIAASLGEQEKSVVSHEELKKLIPTCKFFIRTGETSSFSNVILIGGVNF